MKPALMIVAVPVLALYCRAADTWQNAKVISFGTDEQVRVGRIDGSVDSAGNIDARAHTVSTTNDVVVLEFGVEIIALREKDSWLEGRDSLLGRLARDSKKPVTAAPGDTVRIAINGDRAVLVDLAGVRHEMRVLVRTKRQADIQSENKPAIAKVQSAGVLPATLARVAIRSTPAGADIEINDFGSNVAWKPEFYGNTPSTITLHPGTYAVILSKQGFQTWIKKLTVGDGPQEINVSAELVASPPE